MNTTWKVFLACGIGAFIGSLVALQMQHNWWWLGMLAGGFAGYLSYEFNNVCKAVPVAFKEACEWKLNPSGSWLFWKAIMLKAMVSYVFSFWAVLVIMFIGFCAEHKGWTLAGIAVFWLAATLVFGTLIAMFMMIAVENTRKDHDTIAKIESSIEDSVKTIFALSPVNVVKQLLRGVGWLLARTPVAAAFTWKFLKIFFIMIHSDMRVLCGIDAALGTAAGYFFGNAIVGFLTGALWGVFNYKIVSQRWLHLNVKAS